MIKNTILLIAISGLILFSCGKEKYSESPEITVGEYTNMIIKTYNTLLDSIGYQNIDLNQDGIDDIQFEFEILYWKAWSYHHRTLIRSFSKNVEFLGFISPDTLFINKDTEYDIAGAPVKIIQHTNYTCQRFSEKDSIDKITQTFKLKSLDEGDILSKLETFYSDTIIIFESPFLGTPLVIDSDNDTLVLSCSSVYQTCNNFPLEEIKYIGVKFNDKLGWIKFLLPAADEIRIIESGFQK